MIFNKGSHSSKFATITVNCPTQSTVVCSLGQFSYTKNSGSSKSVSFEVPISGTWTVTITWGGQTYTTTVSATSQGTVLNAKFRYYIFKSGEGKKVGLSYYNAGSVYKAITEVNSFDCTYNAAGITNTVCTDGKIDLSQFSKFVMDCTNHGNTGTNLHMFVHTEPRYAATNPNVYTFGCPDRAIVTWDISSHTATLHAGINNGSSWGAAFYNWYLEV